MNSEARIRKGIERGRRQPVTSKADERLAQLYSAHARPAARLALLLTSDEQAAQDITQEAFVRVGARFTKLRDPDNAAGYLYRTVHNLARGHGRSLQHQRKLKERLGTTQPQTRLDLTTRDEIWQSLLQLPLRQRTAIFLRYYLDLAETDAARVLDCSVPAMKSLTHRAIDSLRRQREGAGS